MYWHILNKVQAFFCIRGKILVFIRQYSGGVSSIEPNMISKVGCEISLLSNCSVSAILAE